MSPRVAPAYHCGGLACDRILPYNVTLHNTARNEPCSILEVYCVCLPSFGKLGLERSGGLAYGHCGVRCGGTLVAARSLSVEKIDNTMLRRIRRATMCYARQCCRLRAHSTSALALCRPVCQTRDSFPVARPSPWVCRQDQFRGWMARAHYGGCPRVRCSRAGVIYCGDHLVYVGTHYQSWILSDMVLKAKVAPHAS